MSEQRNQQENRWRGRPPSDVLGVRLGWEDLTNEPTRWSDIFARIDDYSLAAVLDYLGRISAVLFARDAESEATQLQLCNGLLGSAATEIWRARSQYLESLEARQGRPGFVVLFDDVSVALAAKIALARLPADRTTASNPARLAEALLMLNDQVGRWDARNSGISAVSRKPDELAYFAYVIGIARNHDNWLHALARTYEIFLTDNHALKGHPDYIDLPTLLGEATGLPPQHYWSVLFALYSHFAAINADTAHNTDGFIRVSQYFSGYDFSPDDVDRFFALLSLPLAHINAEAQRAFSIQDPGPYQTLAIARSPMVRLDDRIFCPVLRILFDRISDGLYHTLLNALPADHRERFMRYIGVLFESYVDETIRRGVNRGKSSASSSPIYLDASSISRAVSSPKRSHSSCDGMLVFGDEVVLIECKARFYTAAAQAGLARKEFLDRLKLNLTKSASQLEATIDQARRGAFEHLGVSAKNARFFPVMVTLARLPIQPMLTDWIGELLREEGLLRDSNVSALEVLECHEFEGLMTALGNGVSTAETLRRKANDPLWRKHSVNNFALFCGLPMYGANDPYLETAFKQISAEALAFMQAHKRARTG